MPVVGFLYSSTPKTIGAYVAGLSPALAEAGYVEGRNVIFDYRMAEDHYERLPGLADDLVRRRVTIIFTAGNVPAALAAKAATQTIPIVFIIGGDPIEDGLVGSLARPGGNITGVTLLAAELQQKRFGLLHELVPTATMMAYLINPTNPSFTEAFLSEQMEIAGRLGVRLVILKAANPGEIEEALATRAERPVGALLVGADTLFIGQRAQIVALAARYQTPACYFRREFAEAGGLVSYAASFRDAYRQAGAYAGRILNGEKPGNLPVQQPTRFELVINLKSVKALGLTFPETLLATADEVIQ
jgi:putative tryptophan/tyrosine transport system substrate-binding protein